MIHQDDDQDDIIHHDPVELGGGPGLQLLSQPESEVVKTPPLKVHQNARERSGCSLGELSLLKPLTNYKCT